MTLTITDPILLAQLATAGSVVELADPAGRSLGVLTRSAVADILAAAKAVGDHPLFAEHQAAVAEYRRQHNTVPDADRWPCTSSTRPQFRSFRAVTRRRRRASLPTPETR